MSALQFTLRANQTSQPFLVSAGERVTTTGTGKVQYTLSGQIDINNGFATWLDWSNGTTAGFDDAVMGMYCRAVATTDMTITVGDADTALDGLVLKDGIAWKGQRTSVSTPAGFYLPSGWNSNIKAKLAAAGSGQAKIACVGDSLTVTQFCSNLETKSWPGLLRASLQTTYGDGGSGYKTSGHSAVALANSTYTNAGVGGVVAVTGTWVMGVPDGPGASCIIGQTANATSTWPVRGTSVEVFYVQGNAGSLFGTFTVTIDGSLVDTVNSNGTPSIQQKTYAVSAGAHTVVITATTAAGANTLNAFICGVSGRNATGVIVDNYGHGNWPSTAMANTTGNTWDIVSNGSGAAQGTYGMAGKWSGGSLRSADLVIWAFGANDCRSVASGYGVGPTIYENNLRGYLDDVRGANPNTDVLLVLQHIGQGLEDTTLKYYTQYADRLRTLADTYNAGYVNLWGLGRNSYLYGTQTGYWGDQAVPGAAGTSGVHVSDVGGATIFNYISTAILS